MDKKTKLIKLALGDTITEEKLNHAIAVLSQDDTPVVTGQNPFLTEREACSYCGHIARSTLWQWRKAGLKSYQINGRRLFRAPDLEAFVVNNNMEVCHE